jgi:hypothetical protein
LALARPTSLLNRPPSRQLRQARPRPQQSNYNEANTLQENQEHSEEAMHNQTMTTINKNVGDTNYGGNPYRSHRTSWSDRNVTHTFKLYDAIFDVSFPGAAPSPNTVNIVNA